MILPRVLRQQTPLRAARQATSRIFQVSQRRFEHRVPPLTNYDDAFRENGIPGLLSPDGFNLAWTQYQKLMTDELNARVAGSTFANETTQSVVVQVARLPAFASTFNYASMALNNHFFFKMLSPEETSIPIDLAESLSASFTSIDTLKHDFLSTANAMFGPGFVWLVWHRRQGVPGAWRILPTYLAGSPLSDAHWRQQPVDMNTQNPTSVGGLSGADYARQSQVQNTAGVMGPHSAAGKAARQRAPGGADVVPVLCVNTWEHVWLKDYGINGKVEFLENWWRRINWNEVYTAAPDEARRAARSSGLY